MKILILVSLLAFTITLAQAQSNSKSNGKISGSVIDSLSSAPVEFANVAIVDPATGKPVDGAVCDEKGKFSIKKMSTGNYILMISFIGYHTRSIPITLREGKSNVDVGKVTLGATSEQLAEVVVEGQKELIEEKVDRTIYNAEQDLTTKGGNAADVLKRVPMLTVDMDGNVTLRGSGNVKVLINNKPSTISASSVADALKQIPADMIKNVEVITSPSSKYDAEGSAGIINIVLKKNTLEGMFLNVDGSAANRFSNLNISTSYRTKKMGLSVGLFVRSTYNEKSDFYNNQTTFSNGDTIQNIQQSPVRSNGNTKQFTLSWDYDINSFNLLNISARYGDRNQYSYQDHLLTERIPNNGPPTSMLQNISTIGYGPNADVSLTYTKLFPKKDREFNLLGIYSQNNPSTGFTTDSLSQVDYSILKSYKNQNHGETREITVQLDYQEPLAPGHLIEFGAKSVNRLVTSAYTYSVAGANGEYAPWVNPLLSNGFNYDQRITSGYFSYTGTVLQNYSLKGGMRYEYTDIHAHFENQPAFNIPSYGVLVPSVNFSRKLKNGNLIRISYNKRIQRPTLRDLNPNLQASNSLNATIGNPFLTPEYTDNAEIAYKTSFKTATVNLSLFLRNNRDDIQQARIIRNDTIISIYQNIGTENNYGGSFFTTIPFTEKFTLNAGTDMFYRLLKNNSNNPYVNASKEAFVINVRFSGTYNFSKTLSLQFFGVIPGRNYNLQGYRTNPFTYSLAVRKDIWGSKGSLGLGLDNFLAPSYQVLAESESPYLKQSTKNTIYNAIIRVTFGYRIGRQLPERKRKADSEDDN